MDPLLALLDAVGTGLASVLAALAFLAARRYSERRFGLVGVALVALGIVTLVALVDLANPQAVPGAGLGYPPVGLIILAEALLYLSLITSRGRAGRLTDG
jgi:hypothetical protein